MESDFLISPGDVYPNRKVELEDADIKDTTRVSFEVLCEEQHEAFSKNNKDICRTQLWCDREKSIMMGVTSDSCS